MEDDTESARIVVTTCAGAGSDTRATGTFDAVVDEAGKTELGLGFVVLRKRAQLILRLLLVGDRFQGLPRNSSESVPKTRIVMSAMASFLEGGVPSVRLNQQYSMPRNAADKLSLALTKGSLICNAATDASLFD